MKRKKRFGGKVYRFSYRIGLPVCSKPARDGVIASVPITEAPSARRSAKAKERAEPWGLSASVLAQPTTIIVLKDCPVKS